MITKLYVLDDDIIWLDLIKQLLPNYSNKELFIFTDANEFIEAVKEPAILLIDIDLKNPVDGIDVFIRTKQTQKIVFPIFMSNRLSFDYLKKITSTGWGARTIDKGCTDFFDELSKLIAFADITMIEKYSAHLKMYEIEKQLKQKAQQLLNIVES